MNHRHLDVPGGTPAEQLGAAAIDDLLDRGDLGDWAPLARAVAADPWGPLADTVLGLVDAHPMYGTGALWRSWIGRLRDRHPRSASPAAIRRWAGLTQAQLAERLGMSQSDVSKLERRDDARVSTLRRLAAALGGTLTVRLDGPAGPMAVDLAGADPDAGLLAPKLGD